MLLVLVLWTGTTHGQMRGDFLLTKELVVDLHVGEVQVDLLRIVEEPRGFPGTENPNGASPGLEKLVYCHDTSFVTSG